MQAIVSQELYIFQKRDSAGEDQEVFRKGQREGVWKREEAKSPVTEAKAESPPPGGEESKGIIMRCTVCHFPEIAILHCYCRCCGSQCLKCAIFLLLISGTLLFFYLICYGLMWLSH